ncbi:MAG: SDR family NAD(P)-dependent oxidoreductase [Planctomycetaceae bacterium]|nr:SDR family NAD(P)-dependent oxidoreductase [Planctomycetaceae bacterium]
MDKTELINVIAPAMRALAAQDNRLKLVRFDETATTHGGIAFDPPAGGDAAAIIAALSGVMTTHGKKITAVAVDGLGMFSVYDHPAGGAGRVAGKVALVTGAAQGFGLEIAQNLAEQGACVVLGDINAAGAQKAAADLISKHGAQCAMGLAINVTDGASVAAAIHQVVRTFGGLDILVSNAGVLKAGSVKTQSEKDFDFVTAVNYKGFFLCVQKVAPVLAVQHQARPGYTSDIIQINSKSGLEGSNRNGAYAGSKFGGLGLTQSYAMELVTDGIKVNAICPGNFLDGPLWSDPDNGLFVQYLRTGKVPGAKSIADVRKFYEGKVPMGRGCTTGDVMTAVYYLIDQQYETGQALPVTGGQVMLK